MRVLRSALLVSTVVVTAACGGEAEASEREQILERQLTEVMSMLREMERQREIELAPVRAVDDAFQFDDAAPALRTAAASSAPARAPAPVQRQPAPAPRTQPVGRSAAEPVFYPAPAETRGEPRVVRETTMKRDAAIGAGVGAAVGAVANRNNRVKGAIIGAAVGGAAGAVVGATVNRTTTIVYD
jgi:hypothetical protein